MKRYTATLSNEEKTVTFTLTELARWDALDAAQPIEQTPSRAAKTDYLWAYFAAKAAGKLDELGVDEAEPLEAIRQLASAFELEVDEQKKAVPLAPAPAT